MVTSPPLGLFGGGGFVALSSSVAENRETKKCNNISFIKRMGIVCKKDLLMREGYTLGPQAYSTPALNLPDCSSLFFFSLGLFSGLRRFLNFCLSCIFHDPYSIEA